MIDDNFGNTIIRRTRGIVVKFFMEKGTGFVRANNTTIDSFIHHEQIEPSKKGWKKLAIGDLIEYDQIRDMKGLAAKDIKIINSIYHGETDASNN